MLGQDEVRALLDRIEAAERRLRGTVERFADADLRAPSLCPGWSRSHVIAHVTLNAHSLVNLMNWARTGKETPQYPGWSERDEDIELRSARTTSEHLAALAGGTEAFRAAAEAVPADRWSFEVRGIGGEPQPVGRFLFGRLREVEIHHVDLRASYRPSDWDDSFVRELLGEVPGRLGSKVPAPFTAEATDLGLHIVVGEGPTIVDVAAPGAALLTWLLGRSKGSDVEARGGPLPLLPAWG